MPFVLHGMKQTSVLLSLSILLMMSIFLNVGACKILVFNRDVRDKMDPRWEILRRN